MQAIYRTQNFEFSFTDSDVINPEDYDPHQENGPYMVKPWLFHVHGFTIGIVFASDESDALDILADSGKLDSLLITPEEEIDYQEREDSISYLGNYGKPYDIESLGILQLPTPKFSFCALFNHQKENQ